ncbi:variant erythrocyte surface antigen-1 family protein [Babesia caballi]|uniref:Variant erythrocyte surface antigen-1 family protein n=1 Tax=Babesia caballi TaxID=5871 RepID=A0AAV4LXY6_BABCB|nr:variant erythrocyte surface antigen-1 family protein [Babesia caballi]
MTSGKSLTTPPTNLKEAIDWVLRVSGKDKANDNGEGKEAIESLASELIKLLNKDGSTLVSEVNGFFGTARSGLQTAVKSETSGAPYKLNAYLNDITRYGRPLGEDETIHLKKALQQDVSNPRENSGGPISKLADGLKKFIGWPQNGGKPDGQNGIGSQNYESSYNSATERWSSLKSSQHRDCVAILLGIMPVLYFGLSYLYWWCTSDSDGDPRWSKLKINGGGVPPTGGKATDLKTLLTKVGFTHTSKLNGQTTGQNIVQFINTGFNELKSAKAKSNDYPEFLKELQDKAPKSTPPTSSPLTSLYLLSYYYITNFLYEVQSTSPATPSFAGYSGVAAMAGGAYGFNLGGLGTFMSALLA